MLKAPLQARLSPGCRVRGDRCTPLPGLGVQGPRPVQGPCPARAIVPCRSEPASAALADSLSIVSSWTFPAEPLCWERWDAVKAEPALGELQDSPTPGLHRVPSWEREAVTHGVVGLLDR